ncbi:hypothetical protein F5148DRAFT_1279192 [Russula earlei]|uniref:Uncharacterized protein n=1 Tax=Russula earlei TaxID=71964 RepID=A0ACC0UN69_9AGAM|nr:hypothetical protein F5148DRAFT_1279192 [Russula earlei]
MDLGPLPPLPPNPNPTPKTPQPPEKPPDPGKSYPLRGEPPKNPVPALIEGRDTTFSPDLRPISPVENEANVPSPLNRKVSGNNQPPAKGDDLRILLSHTTECLNIIQKGFLHTKTLGGLDASDWASLCCHLVNAIGRGFLQAVENLGEAAIKVSIAGSTDPMPLAPNLPTLFHRLTDTSNLLAAHLAGNLTNYQDKHSTILEEYRKRAAKKATVEVDETWRLWKEQQVEQ